VPIYVVPQIGVLEAMRGRFDVAREHIERARDIATALGRIDDLAYDWSASAAKIEMMADCPEAAESILRPARDLHLDSRNAAWIATHTAALAESLHAQGLFDDGLRLAADAMAAAPLDDLRAQIGWRLAHAKSLADTGSAPAAERTARRAVELLEGTDVLSLHGEALFDLAKAAALNGNSLGAKEAAQRGLELLHAKRDLVTATAVRAFLDTGDYAVMGEPHGEAPP
jgi:tetratricopeptide (TPR) repeat protein